MNADERDEIAASVAAHAELGSRYDTAMAEGLAERTGEEIGRRVDARPRGLGQLNPPRQDHQHSSPAAVVMVLLIWFFIAVINIAHSQRK